MRTNTRPHVSNVSLEGIRKPPMDSTTEPVKKIERDMSTAWVTIPRLVIFTMIVLIITIYFNGV